jgi:hypothetical protein
LRAKQLGLSLDELEELTVGFVTDLIIEANNDHCEYKELATQEDFNRF